MAGFQRDACRADVSGCVRLAPRCRRLPALILHRRVPCGRRRRVRCIDELLQSRIAELKSRMSVGRPAGSHGPVAAVCRHDAGCGRRAWVRSHPPHPPRPKRDYHCRRSRLSCASNSTCCWSTRKLRSPLFRRCCPLTPHARVKAIELIKQVLSARGELTADDKERMQRIVQLFGVGEKKGTARNLSVVPLARKEGPAKAS